MLPGMELTTISTVDYNGKQIDGSLDDVLPMGDLKEMEAFGWETLEIEDGNNMKQVIRRLAKSKNTNRK